MSHDNTHTHTQPKKPRVARYCVALDAMGAKRLLRLKKDQSPLAGAFWVGECEVPAHELREALKAENRQHRNAERRRRRKLEQARRIRPLAALKAYHAKMVKDLAAETPFRFSFGG